MSVSINFTKIKNNRRIFKNKIFETKYILPIYFSTNKGDTVESLTHKDYIISSYVWDILKDIFTDLYTKYLYNDFYVICPVYKTNNSKEIQLGITGKALIGEDINDSLKREVLEELCLSFKNKPDLFGSSVYKNCIELVWSSNILNTEFAVNNTVKKALKDDRKYKVGCVVYGDKNFILEYLKKERIIGLNEDNIIGHCAVPLNMCAIFSHNVL